MPESGPRPGRWSTDYVPYLREPLRAFSDPHVEVVGMVTPAQSSKTEGLLCVAGWHMDCFPRETLIYEPTEKLARSLARTRLHQLFQTASDLNAKQDPRFARPGSMERFVSGCRLGIGWMGSKVETASHPAAMVLVDELDLAAEKASDHDPMGRAYARTKAFPGSKLGAFSTPTYESTSAIMSLWRSGTKKRWCWQCVGCGFWFAPELKHAKFEEKADYADIRAHAWIECPQCKAEIRDEDKAGLECRYIAHIIDADGAILAQPDLEVRNSVATYWVTGFSSPMTGIGKIMEQYVRAARDGQIDDVRTVVTEWCGEPWKESGERVRSDDVRDCETDVAPDGRCQLVTASVDVQKDSLYFVVRGWWPGSTSMLAEHGQIQGPTEFDDVWLALQRTLDAEFFGRPIDLVFVDSGYQTAQVLEWCRRNPRWSPSRGQANLAKPYMDRLVDESRTGRAMKSLRRWDFNTDIWKTWLYSRICWDKDTPGAWFVPRGVSDDYCAQVVNEEVRITRGRRVWTKTGSGANHLHDCEVGAAVAAHVMNVRSLRPDPKPSDAPQDPRNAREHARSPFARRGL